MDYECDKTYSRQESGDIPIDPPRPYSTLIQSNEDRIYYRS